MDEKKGWDGELSGELKLKWSKWVTSLKMIQITRTITPYLEDVTAVALHHMADASKKAVSAQTVAVVMQPSGTTHIQIKDYKTRFKYSKARIGSMSNECKSSC